MKISLNLLFKFFILKNLIKNLFITKVLNNKFYFFKYDLNFLLKKNYYINSLLLEDKKKKKYIKIKFLISKFNKYKIFKKNRLHLPLFFFNKYFKKKYITFISFFIKILNLKFKRKKSFLFY
jgi:hypothetical protein